MKAAWPYTVVMYSHREPAQVVAAGSARGQGAPRVRVAIGFGSPADDSGIARLDLNEVFVKHAQASFLMRVSGSSMREAGIDDGDLVLVDRAIKAVSEHVVIAVVGDGFVCRRLVGQAGEVRLRAADDSVNDIVANEGEEFQVWGVVTHAIKSLPV
jgi:DNA polymerase V